MTLRRFFERPVALSLVVAPLLPLALDSACWNPPNVGFQLAVPSSVSGQAAWIEVGAFSQAVCPSATQLAGGVAMGGATARLVFPSADPSPPAFGDLPKGKYAFAAVARAANCSVIAQGCAVVDESSGSNISLKLNPIPQPAGACEPGNACLDAVCVLQSDAGGAVVGSGCTLAFVGGGPLADPLGLSTTLLSPPAIVATTEGFLLAYREFDPDTGMARLTLIPVDDRGASSAHWTVPLENRCIASPETDGTALAWSGSSGAVAVARRRCPSGSPGVDIYAVDASGKTMGGGFASTGAEAVQLSQAHALAFTPAGLVLTTVDVASKRLAARPVTGTSLAPPSSVVSFGDLSSPTGAYVTGTSLGTGLLSLGTSAGSDGGTDPLGEGGVPLVTASFTTLPSTGSLSKLPAPSDFPAGWLSLAGVDSRILIAANGGPSANPVMWYAFDIGAVMPTAVSGFAPQALGAVAYADVALHGDNAFFAVQVADSIALLAFRKASTYPELLVESDFAKDARIPIGSIRDGLVAVAADDTRVAVAWGTGRTVSSLEDLGGYAVFQCVP